MKFLQPCRPLSVTDFVAWLAGSRAGDVVEYHRGFLAIDRNEFHSTFAADHRRRVIAIADAAYDAAAEGWVHLVQRRLESHRFCYLAIRRDTSCRIPSLCRGKSGPVGRTKCTVISLAERRRLPSRLDLDRGGNSAETDTAIDLQVGHVRSRYAISRPLALVIVEHAFGEGGRRS